MTLHIDEYIFTFENVLQALPTTPVYQQGSQSLAHTNGVGLGDDF